MSKETELREIKAPNSYNHLPRPYIFLAGSIEMGTAENWQEKVAKMFPSATILNPRRDDWDTSWKQSIDNPQFREQVEWELKAQEDADLIVMHFDQTTKSPITLLELGLFTHSHKLVVHCPEGYWRKGNVDIVCQRYGVKTVNSIEELALLPAPATCPECKGTGEVARLSNCGGCLREPLCPGLHDCTNKTDCPTCNGTGKAPDPSKEMYEALKELVQVYWKNKGSDGKTCPHPGEFISMNGYKGIPEFWRNADKALLHYEQSQQEEK